MANVKAKTVWRKAPPELIAAFDRALPQGPGIEKRKMFGYPAVFSGGKLASGLWQEFVVAKLGEADRENAMARHGAAPFEPMPGRRMREYVVLPERIVADPAALRDWIAKAVVYAASSAPATRKARTKTKTRKDRGGPKAVRGRSKGR
jgi:TfoX/Sxy family transcriptional regulator of competence genes